MRKILVGLLLVFGAISYGQSVTGTSGLIHIPSARMLEDGQLVLGAAYIPKPFFVGTGGIYKNSLSDPGLNTYLTFGILPFAEIMFRYTHQLNARVNTNTKYFPDRMFSLRLMLKKESQNFPSIVFGLHDFGRLLGKNVSVNSHRSSTYIVGSKKLKLEFIGDFDFTIGHSFDFFNLKSNEYDGFFIGTTFYPAFSNNLSVIIEHDSKNFNVGAKIKTLNKMELMLGFWDLNKLTISFSYFLKN